MKLGKRVPQSFLILLLLLLFQSILLYGDERTVVLESRELDFFDDPAVSKWIVVGSKFSEQGFPKSKLVEACPEALVRVLNKKREELKCLGVQGSFIRKGYNYIEMIPAKEAADENGNTKLVPKPIAIPGRATALDLWVWGSRYDYYLECHLQDFRGIVYTLDLGDLTYTGWKNLRVEIPSYIPQARLHVPFYEGLVLTKLVLWTRPKEKVDKFYLYIDHMKVITDIFESPFDGEGLADSANIDRIWGEGESADGSTEELTEEIMEESGE